MRYIIVVSIFFTNISDDIIRINFKENFFNNNKILFNNVEKINLVMEFNKLNLSNISLCSN